MDNLIYLVPKLKKVNILKNLNDNEIVEIMAFSSLTEHSPNQHIFKEGDMGTSIYMIIAGEVKIYKKTAKGAAYEIATIGENDFFGEMSFLDETRRSANAIALHNTQLVSIDDDRFKIFANRHSNAAFRFLKNITIEIQRRFKTTNEKLVKNYDVLVKAHTELVESRNFLNSALLKAPEMVIVLDMSEKVLFFNEMSEAVLKITASETLGKRIDILFSGSDFHAVLKNVSTGGVIHSSEFTLKTFTGRSVSVDLVAGPLTRVKDGNVFQDGIILMARPRA